MVTRTCRQGGWLPAPGQIKVIVHITKYKLVVRRFALLLAARLALHVEVGQLHKPSATDVAKLELCL